MATTAAAEKVDPKALSPSRACKEYGFSRATIDRAIKRKELAAFKVGRRVVLFPEDIEKWIRGE